MTRLLKNCRSLAALPALALWLLIPSVAASAPGDTIFADDFEDGTLFPWVTSNAVASGVSNAPGFSGSGVWGAFTRHTSVSVTSPAMPAGVPEAQLQIWIRRGADSFSEDTDTNEDLVLEYRRANNTWASLRTYFGSGTNGQIYNDTFILPPDALHNNLALRLRQTSGSGVDFDYWHFDNVRVTEIDVAPPITVGSCDDFERGLTTNWTINGTTGFAGTSAATSQSPIFSMYLNGGVVEVTSNVVDTSSSTFGDLTVWVQRGSDAISEDPDTNENLVIEYLDSANNWMTLSNLPGNGAPGQVFNLNYDLPAAGRHAGFRLRFRMTGGSGAPWDFWHVDDVCFDLSTDPVLLISKISQPLSDPVNGTAGPKAIPGAIVLYTIGVSNQGLGTVDNNSLQITDALPANTALFVDTSGGDPIVFVDGATASGLSYLYASDVIFSNQLGGGPPYNYVPVPDAQGFDPNVTGIQINPGGTMSGAVGSNNPSFNLRIQVRVE